MTRRERVIKAAQHQTPDIIPYQVDLTQAEFDKVTQATGKPNFYETVGNHISGAGYEAPFREDPENPGHWYDMWGVCWNRTVDKDIGVVENYQIREPNLSGYKFPELDDSYLRNNINNMLTYGGDTLKMACIGFSMFERAWTLRGMENLLSDMILEPNFALALLEKICEYNLRVIDIALEYDIDAVYFGDDWGQQHGMIMGPKLWRQFIKPQMAAMYGKVKSAGKLVVQHSCGDIQAIFPDLIDIGLDIYQTFQPEIYDIKKIKKEFGSNLSFWGGISTQQLLVTATPEVVKETTIRTMRIMGENGGYIAAPTHAVPGDVPVENILMLLEIFHNQDKYL